MERGRAVGVEYLDLAGGRREIATARAGREVILAGGAVNSPHVLLCSGVGPAEVLRRYAVWHLLRRLRHRNGGADTTHSQLATIRQQLQAAIVLLDWLTTRDLTLQTADQGDLESWLVGDQASLRLEVGHFVRWANAQKLTSLDFPATRWGGPTGIIDTQTRWQQARWLLHDPTLDPEDRVAGLLVLLYAQWPSAVSRLSLDHVHASDDGAVRPRLGREPVVLPEPLASLVLELVASRRGHAWQRASSGDWTDYAAQVSRRTVRQDD